MESSVMLWGILGCIGVVCFCYFQKTKKQHFQTLKPSETIALELIDKKELSHDTRRFRFALPSKQHVLGLPVGQHLSLRYKDENGKLVMRPYTPVTSDDEAGYVDLVIKVYFKNIHPKFPLGGKMSQHLNEMALGQKIDFSGPKGKLIYKGRGIFHIKHRPRDTNVEVRKAKQVGMIAGGTGITPMLQIMRQAIKDNQDHTQFYLLFANQTEQDILLRSELDDMAKVHENIHIWYTVDKSDSADWKYSTGFVNQEMIKTHLPAPSPDTQVLICGPPPMLKFAILPAFEELKYTPEMHFSF